MKPPRFQIFVNTYYKIKKSFKNFFKSSFLSILVILLIFLLITKMDQAYTLLIDIIENKQDWLALLLSFIFVNTLAIALSHYPIFNYYSANLNNSGDYTIWNRKFPFNFWPMRKFPVFIYTINKDSKYVPDKLANYFRYALGLIIHGIWIHFIIKSFERNLIFDGQVFTQFKWILYVLMITPLVVYIIYKERLSKINFDPEILKAKQKENKLLKNLGFWYCFIFIISRFLLILTVFFSTFSKAGFVLLYMTSLSFMFNYIFFRLARKHFSVIETLVKNPLRYFIKTAKIFENDAYYLLIFHTGFVIVCLYLLYATLAVILDLYLPNSLPILLGFFYFYYFIIANVSKYFFVSLKLQSVSTNKYKLMFGSTLLLLVLLLVTKCSNMEVRTHELDLVKSTGNFISEEQFLHELKNKEGNYLFFIASHGGGTKSNVWTLNLLNNLQQRTNGQILDQTIALSGASGGSLGLALYAGLFREHGHDFNTIQQKIDIISKENFTSMDLTFTFGLDTYRKLWPLNQDIGIKDRPYYSMRKYQNFIEGNSNNKLSLEGYRSFMHTTNKKMDYFPSLIMNTAGTNGKRGILWSVKQDTFQNIFPFAENLADLQFNQTLPFYQAVSTTDRFPVFSPAAKIPGYGHYIDAGAIDNSGLLSCLDLHNYLSHRDSLLKNKNIVYIEMINSKALYVSYLVKKFKKLNNLEHIVKNEKETDNIIADIQTGLNLDKIPGYLSDYLGLLEKNPDNKLKHIPLYMPHKINIRDIESYLNGTIEDENLRRKIVMFLTKENHIIFSLTESPNKPFLEKWSYYEPTLSRHLSKSSINYIHKIIEHPLLQSQFREIENFLINQNKGHENTVLQSSGE